jgi:tetratricopeptide (TPR) repeat protein
VHRDFVSKIDQPLCTGNVRKQTAKALKQVADSYGAWLTLVKGAGNTNSGAAAGVSAGAIEAYNDGLAAANRQDYKTAAREFSKALAHGSLPAEQAYIVHMSRATVYYRDHQALPAIQDLTAAIRLKPDDIRAYGARASLYQGMQQDTFALADYAKMRELAPGDIRVRMAHGDLSLQLGRYADAIQDYNVVLRVYSSNTGALTSRGLAYRSAGDFDHAAQDLKRVVSVRPTGDSAAEDILPAYLCDALARSKNPAAAIAVCNNVIRQNRYSALSLEALGYAQYRLRRYREALQGFAAAARIYPNRPEYLFAQGVAKIKAGDAGGGRRDIAEAQQLAPNIAATMAKQNLRP